MKTLLIILAVAGLSVAAEAGKKPKNPGVLPLNSSPHGHTYAEWSAKWWEWIFSIEGDVNPIEDPDGGFGATNQSGKVWFLAGTSYLSGGENVDRDLTIPKGTMLFFPILNNVWVTFPGIDPPFSDAGAEEAARTAIAADPDAELVVEVDGEALTDLNDYRVESTVFTVTMPEDNWFDLVFGYDVLAAGTYPECVSDGYWVMLSPLTKGTHTIHLRGTSGTFTTEVTYNLTVE